MKPPCQIQQKMNSSFDSKIPNRKMSVLTLSLFLVGISSTLACDCVKYTEFKTIQQLYCEADFVIAGQVFGSENAEDDQGNANIKLKIRITNWFKGKPDNEKVFNLYRTHELYTYATRDKCGLPLVKSSYVLGGGKLWISECDLNYPGNDLPCEDYKRGCECEIRRCSGIGHCQPITKGCTYRGFDDRLSDACVPVSYDTCEWKKCDKMQILQSATNGIPVRSADSIPVIPGPNDWKDPYFASHSSNNIPVVQPLYPINNGQTNDDYYPPTRAWPVTDRPRRHTAVPWWLEPNHFDDY
ncbi:unnamed protein product [Mytilus coruscus]|uniref:NTR domain-containing protein n=1 Tax=Mytilus coruscus TaxID=42192 RepID=A0A6J8CE16_MYTCO|nr:unnamed protein product [Mytilus coruscus]